MASESLSDHVVQHTTPDHLIIDSIRQIDEDSWIIGSIILLNRQPLESPALQSSVASWEDDDGSIYLISPFSPLVSTTSSLSGTPTPTTSSLSDTPALTTSSLSDAPKPTTASLSDTPTPTTSSLSDAPTPTTSSRSETSRIRNVYDVGGSHACWSIGNNVFCKIVKAYERGTTLEHVTIAALQRRSHELSFDIPNVIFHLEQNGRYYLFITRVKGRTLAEAWPSLSNEWRLYYGIRVVEICTELARWKSDSITGVDGNYVWDAHLCNGPAPHDYSPMMMRKYCEAAGMDCTEFVFYHCDLSPGNIIVGMEPGLGRLGLIDWETAGFVPRDWIRTKFRICSGFDLPTENPVAWRSQVQQQLEKAGYGDVSTAWMEIFMRNHSISECDL